MGEVAPFGIGITLAEPGNVRTAFGVALTVASSDTYGSTSRPPVATSLATPWATRPASLKRSSLCRFNHPPLSVWF